MFWKGACFFEKKRAPARNARNRDEERVFEKKRAPARQTPGVVSELVFTKNPQSHQIDFWITRIEATHPIKPPATLFIHFDAFWVDFLKKYQNLLKPLILLYFGL